MCRCPQPDQDELLIQVGAAGMNNTDIIMYELVGTTRPFIFRRPNAAAAAAAAVVIQDGVGNTTTTTTTTTGEIRAST